VQKPKADDIQLVNVTAYEITAKAHPRVSDMYVWWCKRAYWCTYCLSWPVIEYTSIIRPCTDLT